MCCDSGGQAPAPAGNKFTDTLADIAQKQWARNVSTYQPLEDQLIQQVQRFQTPEFQQEQANKASADVTQQFGQARASEDANSASLGINPADGRYGFMRRGLDIGEAGAKAAAITGARDKARMLGFDALAGVAGKGDAKVGQAIGAASAGGNQYANLQQNQLSYQGQQSQGMGGLGSLVGLGLSFLSSKSVKTHKRPYSGGLDAVRKMPVERWKYKDGVADGGEHVGPYAEDFAQATGMGDGKTIPVVDAMGTMMSAVKELDGQVQSLKGARK